MEKKTLENLRILIVDDQRPFQLMFKGILYSMGASNVAFAPTGEQALLKCSTMPYDILFVDYHLGNGKNGKQLLEDLRERKLLRPHSIFMLITGDNTVPMVMSAVELEPDDYLIKPFSQSVLRSRIQKIQRKKKQLAQLHQALYDENHQLAVQLCQKEIDKDSRYQQYCKRVQVETLLKLQQYQMADDVLSNSLQQSRTSWALLLKAKLHYEQQQYTEALRLSREATDKNRYFAEAYDIQALSLQAMDQLDEAFSCIQAAAEIAPYSLQRQYHVMNIAKALDDFSNQVQASRQLYEITRRSFRQDIIHLLNYIRTVIDAALKAAEPQQRNRFQQEVSIALQRAKRDEILTRDIDFSLFETLCQARLESLNGQQYQAKKTYASVAEQLDTQQDTLPDTIFLLNQIGEYEQASALMEELPPHFMQNPVLKQLMAEQQIVTGDRQQQFSLLNREGIIAYKQGDYAEAIRKFEQALDVAPMNTGSALNFIQAAVQHIHLQKKQNSGRELFERCKKAFRIVDNMPLPEHHRVRYNELLLQFEKLKDDFRR